MGQTVIAALHVYDLRLCAHVPIVSIHATRSGRILGLETSAYIAGLPGCGGICLLQDNELCSIDHLCRLLGYPLDGEHHKKAEQLLESARINSEVPA